MHIIRYLSFLVVVFFLHGCASTMDQAAVKKTIKEANSFCVATVLHKSNEGYIQGITGQHELGTKRLYGIKIEGESTSLSLSKKTQSIFEEQGFSNVKIGINPKDLDLYMGLSPVVKGEPFNSKYYKVFKTSEAKSSLSEFKSDSTCDISLIQFIAVAPVCSIYAADSESSRTLSLATTGTVLNFRQRRNICNGVLLEWLGMIASNAKIAKWLGAHSPQGMLGTTNFSYYFNHNSKVLRDVILNDISKYPLNGAIFDRYANRSFDSEAFNQIKLYATNPSGNLTEILSLTGESEPTEFEWKLYESVMRSGAYGVLPSVDAALMSWGFEKTMKKVAISLK